MPLPDDNDVVTPNFAVVINSVVLSPIRSSSSSSSIRITTTTRIRSLCITIPYQREREREREKQSSSLLYRFIKVIVIFAYIPQESRVKVVLSRVALSFFFLLVLCSQKC